MTKACEKIGYCSIGNAVPTLAYKLNAKFIIHTVVPKWIDGNNSEYDFLSSAYDLPLLPQAHSEKARAKTRRSAINLFMVFLL